MTVPAVSDRFPRGALLGAALMVGLSLAAAAGARIVGVASMIPVSAALFQRDLRFEDRSDGSIVVFDGTASRPSEVIAPGGNNGFLRATVRGLAQERKRQGFGADAPFRLTGWADGRLTLDDPLTRRHIELEAFGPTNAQAFAGFLTLTRPERGLP